MCNENGQPISRNEQLKYPMPTPDKMLFAPTYQLVNLFDPMPSELTLANDLSSFT
ncbi:hypothetical protein K466DRAFT_666709 [Polyporus arcularius HHB13444]|uniref:Uncharacterized protein n=1 Tax=Polyporus arcularius HHB13444 TaxID=1314778 RepID=A0A5C3P8G8_9APHY|nr:hypothetical protein K466DRAFT_666709 [Polyporus arcularius HHB13444]